MAGYREFQTGEVLTAANVNDFLAKQSVMKFADSSARDTALGTAVGGGNALREGMVVYLDDTDTPQYFDGTSWSEFTPTALDASVITTGVFDAERIPDVKIKQISTVNSAAGFATTSTSPVDVTGMTRTITVGSATALVIVVFYVPAVSTSTAAASTFIQLTDAADAVITTEQHRLRNNLSGGEHNGNFVFIHGPGLAGSQTYKLRLSTTAGTTTLRNGHQLTVIEVEP